MALRANMGAVERQGVARTIPNAAIGETVGTSEVELDLADFGSTSLDLSGKWVFFHAIGGAITILRAATTPTMVAGKGFVIAADTTEELYVDGSGEKVLWAISDTAASTLIAAVDSEA